MSKATLVVGGILSLFFSAVLAVAPAMGADAAKSQPAARRDKPKAEWLDPDHSEPQGTKYRTFASKILGHNVSYLMYLPPRYDQESQRYPVVYWLHGMNGTQRTGAECFVPYVDAAIKEGMLPPVIVVLPNGMIDSYYRDEPDGSRPVESVIVKELIPHIDQTYRTIARREGRAIEGYSMGGYGAGHLGFKHPEWFGTVVIDAGALRAFDAKEDKRVSYKMELPSHWVEKNLEQIRGRTHIRIGVGDQDYLFPANREFHEWLNGQNVEHDYEVVPGVKHSGTAYYKRLGTKGFEFLRKALEPAASPAKQAASPSDAPKVEWLDLDHSEPNGTKYQTFSSKTLGRDISYLVYLPPDYDQGARRYPVIYWLQGMNQRQTNGALSYIPHLNEAIQKHLMPPVIVVMPNGMVDSFYRDSADGAMPMESVIIKDLIPHVDRTYRTIADRAGRVIEGYSMGGYGSHLGFKYPELFGTVVISAGAVKPGARIDHVNNADYPEEDPQFLAEKNAGKLRQTQIRIGVGDQDYLFQANEELHNLLTRLKIEHDYELVPGVKHSSTAYYNMLGTKGFEFLRKVLESAADRK